MRRVLAQSHKCQQSPLAFRYCPEGIPMAVSNRVTEVPELSGLAVQVDRFEIEGLFGYLDHKIQFPRLEPEASSPEILIIEGQNGTGKTTILKMIEGITGKLNFDTFR